MRGGPGEGSPFIYFRVLVVRVLVVRVLVVRVLAFRVLAFRVLAFGAFVHFGIELHPFRPAGLRRSQVPDYTGPIFTWVEIDGRFKLAQMPKPLGGTPGLDRSMQALKSAGVDVLVSMLTDDDMRRFRLEDERERANYRSIEFLRFPIKDHQVPESTEDAVAFAQSILAKLELGKNVVFHCYAGIGRSGLMAATVLFLAGLDMADACAQLTKARGHNVPETSKQRDWLNSLIRPAV